VLERVDAYLRRVGSDRDHILTVQVWLADMRRFAEMNEVWNAWVGDGPPPARACVGGELFRRDAAVEIMVTAAVP